MKLREIAHARAGDKGDTSNISVIAYDERDYPLLERHVTAERVREHFAGIVRGEVTRYELPLIGALNFVLRVRAGRGRDPLAGAGRARQEPELGGPRPRRPG